MGLDIGNNRTLINFVSSKLEISDQELGSCLIQNLTPKHYVKIGNLLYLPVPADPTERKKILEHTETRGFYQALEDIHIDSSTNIHLTAGDFNTHTGEEIETHITREERRDIPNRKGDPHHPPNQNLPSQAFFTTSSCIRGTFFLNMLNTTSQLILNGRFEPSSAHSIPATFVQLNQRTIIDYFFLNKRHFHAVKNCTIH